MRRLSWTLVGLLVALGLFTTTRWSLQAQDRPARPTTRPKEAVASAASVQDALVRPFDLPFGEETSLEDVRKYLGQALKAPVVLDLAALERLELTPADKVQLDLKGVRLKVGLKLLLDQVGLSYRVVPEDNLLVLTDPEESADPNERLMAEIKSLHRELHTLQDSVDDLRDLVEEELGVDPETPKDQRLIAQVGMPPKKPFTHRRGSRLLTKPARSAGR